MTAIAERVMPDLPSATRIGQGTAVEQSRAIAEVQAAVVVAQQVPRSIPRAERDMRRSCAQKSLAEKAFYRYPRGGETVSGPSVQLARELARCFGNVQYGVTELRRDDGYGQSEMQAWAWDLETNTRSSTTFIVPHRRDTRAGVKQLADMRDIYENNANNGARRLREMIFAILPGWYTEDAIAACYETLAGDDSELPGRIRQCVEGFEKLGVRQAQLEQKAGGPVEKWTPYDLAQMSVVYRSLMRGETNRDEEFGVAPDRVTAAEITGQKQDKPAHQQRRRGRAAPPDASPADSRLPTPPADDETAGEAQNEPDARPPAKATSGQVGILQKLWRDLGYDDGDPEQRTERLVFTAQLAGIDDLDTTSDLTQDQASRVREALKACKTRADVIELIHGGGNG